MFGLGSPRLSLNWFLGAGVRRSLWLALGHVTPASSGDPCGDGEAVKLATEAVLRAKSGQGGLIKGSEGILFLR